MPGRGRDLWGVAKCTLPQGIVQRRPVFSGVNLQCVLKITWFIWQHSQGVYVSSVSRFLLCPFLMRPSELRHRKQRPQPPTPVQPGTDTSRCVPAGSYATPAGFLRPRSRKLSGTQFTQSGAVRPAAGRAFRRPSSAPPGCITWPLSSLPSPGVPAVETLAKEGFRNTKTPPSPERVPNRLPATGPHPFQS